MRLLPDDQKARIRLRIVRSCKNQTGYVGSRDPQWGCMYAADALGSPDRSLVPKKCACLDLFSLEQRHADFGFNPEYFDKLDISQIELEDRAPLDAMLADPRALWDGQWVYIWGQEIGCGKTTLAHLLVRKLYEWGKMNRVIGHDYKAWYTLASSFGALAAKWAARDAFRVAVDLGNGDEEIDLWTVRGPVVLDEFSREGTGPVGEKAREHYEPFLRERMGLPTIVVGHLAPWEIQNAGISPQTISLMSTMTVLHVAGSDHRFNATSPFYSKG